MGISLVEDYIIGEGMYAAGCMPSATHWRAVSDPSSMKIYYRTMHDGRVKAIDLNRIDFAAERLKAFPIVGGRFTFDDATPQ